MMKLAIFLILFGCIPKTYEQQPWVGFYLSLVWPPGYCITAKNCWYHTVIEKFTIHGLRAIDFADHSPPIPPNGHIYNNKLMYNQLINQLSTSWPDYVANRQEEAFWADEWNKHGIISESLLNQTKYFETAIKMYTNLDIANIDLIPSPFLQDSTLLYMKLMEKLRVVPVFICEGLYLIEVRICYDEVAITLVTCSKRYYNCPEYFVIKNA